MNATLMLQDGTKLEGRSFGVETGVSGEVVFTTGMVGYPEALTDPSYAGQILVFTYPLIGNYGVPDSRFWESDRVHPAGVIVSSYNETPSHFMSKVTLGEWLKKEGVPGLEIKDTRFLTQKLRTQGSMLGKIVFDSPEAKDIPFEDPNKRNLVAEVSTREIITEIGRDKPRVVPPVVLFDCGAKRNIRRNLLKRGVNVTTVPWDFDLLNSDLTYDAVILSNGPGDPKMAVQTITNVQKILSQKKPLLGICLGNQILALAAGGDTYKLKFGHRSQNQPVLLQKSKRCYLTTQNHGYAVGKIPKGFEPWFVNANDQTNEGLVHKKLPIMSVQFHPEATPGPEDTEWIFDYFIERLNRFPPARE